MYRRITRRASWRLLGLGLASAVLMSLTVVVLGGGSSAGAAATTGCLTIPNPNISIDMPSKSIRYALTNKCGGYSIAPNG